MTDWKPGDVAMVSTEYTGAQVRILTNDASVDGFAWWGPQGYLRANSPSITSARPLVVIDPDHTEQVKRLHNLVFRTEPDTNRDHLSYDTTTAALSEFANPTPSKPDEPTGLGAVIQDDNGVLWTRTEHLPNLGGTVWCSAFHVTQPDRSMQRAYADIAAVRVLSPGVDQ
jgi:hypothetical protein